MLYAAAPNVPNTQYGRLEYGKTKHEYILIESEQYSSKVK
jgi:hypothetical protein